jgi:putative SOS response-associated peptidase YedK
MCGRYTARFSDNQHLPESVGVIPEFAPRYNIAPQQTAPIIRMQDGVPRFEELRWGFRPAWLKDKNKAQINARGETLFEKPMFKHSALNRRCLVLASGWYEWQKIASGKQPFAFRFRDDALFAFAGIWTSWHGENDEQEDSYAIVTTDANPAAAPIHNRMPVILDAGSCVTWLDVGIHDPTQLGALLAPYTGTDLNIYPVSTYVNSPKNTGSACLEQI